MNLVSQTIKANNGLAKKKARSEEEFIANGGYAYYPRSFRKTLKTELYRFSNRRWQKK